MTTLLPTTKTPTTVQQLLAIQLNVLPDPFDPDAVPSDGDDDTDNPDSTEILATNDDDVSDDDLQQLADDADSWDVSVGDDGAVHRND
jgi:hypothetical protein